MQSGQSKIYDEAFLKLLLDLIEIVDSFDQLAKMARIANMLYSPVETEFTTLHEAIRKTYAHLRKLPEIGREVGPHWDNSPWSGEKGDQGDRRYKPACGLHRGAVPLD